ncbi:AAA family ATPase [Mesonia sp. K4-1]|uniref:AAA family ATPase n=1 Tax=Mesonia sp. K4-1 TaxID=2602760 RepID=UPI0011C76891|nr:AAA family ATPase [Mesonia sp. K4-1]TXK72993.1 AAA family ATPase [Mesonia sp. K4-1]
MKILKLRFKNINSLKGEHEVDFTQPPFVQNNLFAITGPTGSGKTTLLDVISLALFNQVPRLGKMSTNEIVKKGAILTRNQSEAFAEVTYACITGEYSSRWEISTNRNGNLRDYEMFLADTAQVNLDLKKSEVPGKNEELIGLNYEQFIKSVVLAQGDFAKFLQVKKEERGELLEKITGTGIYRKLGQLAFFKYRDLESAVKKQQDKITTFEEQLISQEEFEENKKQAQHIQDLKDKLQKEVENLNIQITDKKNLIELEKNIQGVENEHLENNKEKNTFEKEKGDALNKHQELQDFTNEINSWNYTTSQLEQLNEKRVNTEEKLKKLSKKLQQNKTNFSSLFGLNTQEDNFTQSLNDYKQQVRNLYSERQNIVTEFKTLSKNIQQQLMSFNLVLYQNNPLETKREVNILVQKKNKEKENLEDEHSFSTTIDFELEQEKIQLQLKNIRAAEKKHLEIELLKKESVKESELLEKNQLDLKKLPQQIKGFQQEIKLQKAQLEAKQNAQKVADLQKKLDDYRQDLQPETPCPLCGSKEHPFAEHLPVNDDKISTEISVLQQSLHQTQKQLTQAETQLEGLQQQNSTLEKKILEIENKIKFQQQNYQEKFAREIKLLNENNFAELEGRFNKKTKALQKYKDILEQLIQLQKLQESIDELNDLLKRGIHKKEAIQSLYKGEDFEKEIGTTEKDYLTLTQENKQLTNEQKAIFEELDQLEKQQEKTKQTLEIEFKNLGYSCIASAIDKLLPPSLFKKYSEELQALKNKQIRLSSRLEELKNQQKDLLEKTTKKPLEELKENSKDQENKRKEAEIQLNELQRIIKNQEQYLKQISKIKAGISQQLKTNKRWKILNDLIGDSKGKKFNDYAQDLTLSQLLMLANKRLVLLTDRYKMDKPLADEDDSLVAIDEHMGGQRRSVKTLSGGETFLLSLALALALSDFASRNVEINSLFIDEGFGTLDPETLDQTLDTLEVLQAKSSKMIGVISHVTSLKERIATQIQLSQNGQGYSSLKVV